MSTKKEIDKAWAISASRGELITKGDTDASKLDLEQSRTLINVFDDVHCAYTEHVKTMQMALDLYRASICYISIEDWLNEVPGALKEFDRITGANLSKDAA